MSSKSFVTYCLQIGDHCVGTLSSKSNRLQIEIQLLAPHSFLLRNEKSKKMLHQSYKPKATGQIAIDIG